MKRKLHAFWHLAVLPVTVALLSIILFRSETTAFPPPKPPKPPKTLVPICHIPPDNPKKFHTLFVNNHAVNSHVSAGDLFGPCTSWCKDLCNDGNLCTEDRCDDRGCDNSRPVSCDDQLACTADSCNPLVGCRHTNLCDDGNPCNGVETCTSTGCQPGTPLVCDDGNPCNGVETCTVSGCQPGLPLVCNDGNLCTNDSCDPSSGCVATNNTLPCDDGDPLTNQDMCWEGSCVGGPPTGTGNLKILTYNTGLLYMRAWFPGGPFNFICPSCDPLEPLSLSPLCNCVPSMAFYLNKDLYPTRDEKLRAQKIAERIRATDQDVVVLNEVFNPAAKDVFVKELADNGPYHHYISQLAGVPPMSDLTLSQAGDYLLGWYGNLFNLTQFGYYNVEPVNSGLMLFSKHPFLPLQGSAPNDADCDDEACKYEGSGDIQSGMFAFRVFQDCGVSDCLASKGVGLVKLSTPGWPRYVAFTHMQADEGDFNGAVVRTTQFKQIQEMILGAIPPAEFPKADVYLVGDLNVYGYNYTTLSNPDASEWCKVFKQEIFADDRFFACGNGVTDGFTTESCYYGHNTSDFFTDAWGYETSPLDFADGSRLDYLLHGTGSRLCMQHATVAWDLMADALDDGGSWWLSDHPPLRFDMGMSNAYCSANTDTLVAEPSRNARVLDFAPNDCVDDPPNDFCVRTITVHPPEANLNFPGNMQWFYIGDEDPGTYTILLKPTNNSEPVAYMVYHGSDLSRPITMFADPPPGPGREIGQVWSLPQPPYYIRVFAVDAAGNPDRTASNRQYTLRVHRRLCREPAEACALDPGWASTAPYPYLWPETVFNKPESDVPELWWIFRTGATSNGKLVAPGPAASIRYPTVRMQFETAYEEPDQHCFTDVPMVFEEYNDPWYPSQLIRQLDATSLEKKNWDIWQDPYLDFFYTAPDLDGEDGQFKYYFVKISRTTDFLDGFNSCNFPTTTWLSYHTNLTYFRPTRVHVYYGLDDGFEEDDDMRIFTGFDTGGLTPDPPPAQSVELSFPEDPLSDDYDASLSGYGQLAGYYLDRVFLSFWETDMEELIGNPQGVPYLPTDSRGGSSFFVVTDNPDPVDADYFYEVYYKQCRFAGDLECSEDRP